MKQLYIIKTGDTFEEIKASLGDFEDWIANRTGLSQPVVIDVQKHDALPDVTSCRGVIISGSHDMVTENLEWSLQVEDFIRLLARHHVPTLGICYGHQLIVKALGGRVDFHPRGMELGSVRVQMKQEAKDDAIFKHLPSTFVVHVVHSQSAMSLPAGARVLAFNDFENFHAFRMESNIWGVQFHPEYTQDVMNAYIKKVCDVENRGQETLQTLLANTQDTTFANQVIPLFVDVCMR
ncbi:glutamine amidotransferase [Sulfurospirillum sp. 1612]|uniref:glutamine amidotransferase n=1 Tax=Sulfurospirillum sp. 1612 TaxID=3094835 RepID=UPI002F9223D7